MKRIILGCCLFAILFNITWAQEKTQKEDLGSFIEVICIDSADYAKHVMHQRQNDVTLSDALKEINNMGEPNSPRTKFYKNIMYGAYKLPKVFDDEQKSVIETEYSNSVHMMCIKTFSDKFS